jgi:hypothetical protein
LPAPLLVGVQFSEMGDNVLTRAGLGADVLDQGEVGELLAGDRAAVASQEHGYLLARHHGQEISG